MDINTIFETPFDFDTYIENWLLTIDDLEERTFARKYVADTMRLIMRESEASYKRLEDRVYAEIPASGNRHHIYMTVVDRDRYDITNGSWFPLLGGDEKAWKARQIKTDDAPLTVDCLYYSGEGEFSPGDPVQGTVQTKSGSHNAVFRLTPAQGYRDQVEHMYNLFRANGLPWTTINCGYLLRFFAVEVTELEGGAGAAEEIIGYTASFGKVDKFLESNRLPLWNVQRLTYDSEQFVIPAIDSKYYEHTFPIETFGPEHGYLLEGNQDVLSFRQTGDAILIVTAQETFKQWVAYQIIHDPPRELHCFDLPILHNVPRDSFVGRFIASNGVFLQSRLEIVRQVEQYDLAGLIRLQDVTLLTDTTEPYDDTYLSVMNVAPADTELDKRPYIAHSNLNWFIQDDLVNRREQKVLLFQFESKSAHYLQYDLISFVISELQRQFNEYRCEAVYHTGSETL